MGGQRRGQRGNVWPRNGVNKCLPPCCGKWATFHMLPAHISASYEIRARACAGSLLCLLQRLDHLPQHRRSIILFRSKHSTVRIPEARDRKMKGLTQTCCRFNRTSRKLSVLDRTNSGTSRRIRKIVGKYMMGHRMPVHRTAEQRIQIVNPRLLSRKLHLFFSGNWAFAMGPVTILQIWFKCDRLPNRNQQRSCVRQKTQATTFMHRENPRTCAGPRRE